MFAAVGALDTWWVTREPGAVTARLLPPTLPVALALFLPWAALQQALFQFYLVGRLRALLPGPGPAPVAVLAGLLFGIVHRPVLDVTAVTAVGGGLWAWFYRARWFRPRPGWVYHPGRRRQPAVSEVGLTTSAGAGNRALGVRGVLAHVLLATDGPDTAKGAPRW